MSEELNPQYFKIESTVDNRKFTINKKIIKSSSMLKNMYEITKITEPISINCSGESLEVFINLINHYRSTKEKHDIKFEMNLYKSFNKQKLIKLIKDLCILDNDFFLDSISDYILQILGNGGNEKDWNKLQEFLGLENDFTEVERNLILGDAKFEYFLSIDSDNFKFPFPEKNFYTLKSDFYTPMNVLLGRIIQRSNAKTSYLLSLINKTIKNEVDRYPLKVQEFFVGQDWHLKISFNKLYTRNLAIFMDTKIYDKKIFNALKTRRIIATKQLDRSFDDEFVFSNFHTDSMNFVITKFCKIYFTHDFTAMYHFDVSKCSMSSISYKFDNRQRKQIKFEELYNHLIAKDFSKQICIWTYDFFNFTNLKWFLWFKKKRNATKFHRLRICNHQHLCHDFIDFIMTYMEDDGIVETLQLIEGISLNKSGVKRIEKYLNYPVSVLKKYLERIIIK